MTKWNVTQAGKPDASFNFLSLMTADQVKASLVQYNGYDSICTVTEATG